MPTQQTTAEVESSRSTDSACAPAQPVRSESSKLDALFPWIAALLFAALALQLGLHLRSASVTYDEPVHIFSGYQYWKCGDHGINPENPPLMPLIDALPLQMRALAGPARPCGSAITPKVDEYTEANDFLVANGIDRVVIPARTAASCVGLLLAALVFAAAWEMFGKAEALVALAMAAFEPTLIAHGSLATTDTAIAAAFFASAFALYMFCKRRTPVRMIALGLSVGAMLAAKHSALPALVLLWVLFAIATGMFIRNERSPTWISFRKELLSGLPGLGGATAIGILCLWAAYGFHFYALPRANQLTLPPSALPPGTGGMAGALEHIVGWMRSAHIFPEAYVYGFTDVLYQNAHHDMFLFGQTYPHARWFYFPIAFLIKTSLPLLVLLAAGFFAFALYRKRSFEMAFLLIPGLGYFAFSLASGLAIGIRQVLPCYPFLICVAAAGACAWARRFPKIWAPIVALLAFGAFDCARAYPNYIAFSNELWGGTNQTYKLLSDSNVDWGQSLKQIRAYIGRNGIEQCWIAANGNPDIALATLPCHLLPAPFQWMDHPMEDIPQTVAGTIFLSTEALPIEFPGFYESVAQTKPTAMIGGAMFVYKGQFEIPQAAEWAHSTNAFFFFQHGRLPDAISEMRQTIAIDPIDPRPHFVLAIYLATAQQKESARDEFAECIRLAAQKPGEFDNLRALAEQQMHKLP